MLSTPPEKKCCLRSAACIEGTLYSVSCRCGQYYYLCPNHCDKVVKEAQQSYPKLVNRKGSDVSRTPLERASIVGHKNFNQILKIMANTSSAFRTTDCAGRLLVSDKISTINKAAKAKIVGAGTATAPESSASSPHNLPASAGDSHPNFKTALCRYGERCIYGERCSFAHNETELRIPTYALGGGVPGAPSPETTVVPSVSVGPGGGANVAIISPITKSASNESFVMQKDDFPGLPGSAKVPVLGGAPRTAASVVAGLGSIRPIPVAKPAPQPVAPVPKAAMKVEPQVFSMSEMSSNLPKSPESSRLENAGVVDSSNMRFNNGGADIFSNYFQSNGSAPGIDNSLGGGFGSDFMSVSSLGGSMFGSNTSGLGAGYLGAPGLGQPARISPVNISPALGPQTGPPGLYGNGNSVSTGSRFDFPNGAAQLPQPPQQQQLQQHPGQFYGQPSGFGGYPSASPQVAPSQQPLQAHMYPAPVLPQAQALNPPPAGGIDADLVPLNTFATVDWLRASDMGIFRWSGNDRAWTEFAMHVPVNFFTFFTSNLPTWQQHSNCRMWFDTDKLRGETQNFLVFRRGENGEESNSAMQRALELISHHLSFILVKNGNGSPSLEPARHQGW